MKKILILLTTAILSVIGLSSITRTTNYVNNLQNKNYYMNLNSSKPAFIIDFGNNETYEYYKSLTVLIDDNGVPIQIKEFEDSDFLNDTRIKSKLENSSRNYFTVIPTSNTELYFNVPFGTSGGIGRNGELKVYFTDHSSNNDYVQLFKLFSESFEYDQNFLDSWGTDYQAHYGDKKFTIEAKGKPGASKPGISGKDSIINNIDSPYTLDDIKRIADITARDDYYGDISNAIKVKTDNYTANKNKVGIFQITYEVTNDFGLSAEYILNIINQDITAPVVSGPASTTQSYTKAFNPADIVNQFTVTDNHDTGLIAKLDSDDYVANKVGTFTFNLSATDKSGNKGFAIYKLNVIDDVAPEIKSSNSGTIQLNWKDTFTDSKLLLGLTATDFIDGDLTNKIKIIANPIKNKIGTYIVKYEVKDNANNVATFEQTFEIITTDAPEFWVSKNLINIEDVNTLTIDQIVAIIANYEKIDFESYTVLENEYLGNETTTGTYNVRLQFTDKLGNVSEHTRVMAVFNGDDLNTEVDSLWYKVKAFFSKVWNVIASVFNFVWKVITAPFKWLGKLLGFGKTKSVVVINRFRL